MRLTKRILAMILSVLMIVTSANVMTFAADATSTITVSSAAGMAGGTVAVTISMSGSPGVVSAMLDVDYDSDVLTLTGVTDGGLFAADGDIYDNNAAHSDNLALDPYRLTWDGDMLAENNTQNGVLATLTFAIDAEAAAGEYPIMVSVPEEGPFRDFYGNVKDFTLVNGGVEVVEEDVPQVEPGATITLGSVRGRPGDIVEVEIFVKTTEPINTIGISDIFENEFLTFVSFVKPEEYIDGYIDPFALKGYDNDLKLISLGLSEATIFEGSIGKIRYQISDVEENTSVEVGCTGSIKNNSTVVVNKIEPAVVTVALQILGDINDNEVVDIEDALLLFQYSLFPDYYPIDYIGNVDFTQDGVVDIADALLLFQYSLFPDYYPLPNN